MMATTFMTIYLCAPSKNEKGIVWMPLPSPYWDLLFFPKSRGRIDTCLRYVVRDLAQRGGEPRKTIVPMILAEIMRSLSACVDGRMSSNDATFYINYRLSITSTSDLTW